MEVTEELLLPYQILEVGLPWVQVKARELLFISREPSKVRKQPR
jgi:hypothetical protein